MFSRCHLLAFTAALLLVPGLALAQAEPTEALTTPEYSTVTNSGSRETAAAPLTPENAAIAEQVGLWDVTETVWSAPGAEPVVASGLVAERRMVGAFLQETLRASDDPASPILRMDYLTFNSLEGTWEYVSMDLRAPVAIMPAKGFGRGELDRIEVVFDPLAVPGATEDAPPLMLNMTQAISQDGPNGDVKDQTYMVADGTGTPWLAHRYAYQRQE